MFSDVIALSGIDVFEDTVAYIPAVMGCIIEIMIIVEATASGIIVYMSVAEDISQHFHIMSIHLFLL